MCTKRSIVAMSVLLSAFLAGFVPPPSPISPASMAGATIVLDWFLPDWANSAAAQDKVGEPAFAATVRAACRDVAEVRLVANGSRGVPILIFEERHDSEVGQIEQAVVLNRLYTQHGLRDIVLEGYLEDDPEVTSEWYQSAASGLDSAAMARVTVGLLESGDINSAEFLQLLYPDVVLHRAERSDTYDAEMKDAASAAPVVYLLLIAQESLKDEHAPKLKRLQDEIEQAEGEKKIEKQRELFDFILGVDPWTKKKSDELKNYGKATQVDNRKHLELVSEIKRKAESMKVDVDRETKQAMEEYLNFFEKRIGADTPLTDAAGQAADKTRARFVAAVMGAGHTDAVGSLLRARNRPFAVIRPLSFSIETRNGCLSLEAAKRKYEGLSVYSEGAMKLILDAFPPSRQKKPRPAVPQAWLQASAEFDVLVERILMNKDKLGGKPPYGFAPDDLTTPHVRIDPNQIQMVPDDPDDNGSELCPLFPVVLNPNDPVRRTMLWVKVSRDRSASSAVTRDDANVEQFLMGARQQAMKKGAIGPAIEDERRRVRLSVRNVAAITPAEETTRRIVLN